MTTSFDCRDGRHAPACQACACTCHPESIRAQFVNMHGYTTLGKGCLVTLLLVMGVAFLGALAIVLRALAGGAL